MTAARQKLADAHADATLHGGLSAGQYFGSESIWGLGISRPDRPFSEDFLGW
jgi:hypothetical protein